MYDYISNIPTMVKRCSAYIKQKKKKKIRHLPCLVEQRSIILKRKVDNSLENCR
jgi:hypothetical protein